MAKIELNFDKPTISQSIVVLLQGGLIEDPEEKLSKLCLKECVAVLARGNKLAYAPANYLLKSLLRMLCIEDSPIDNRANYPKLISSRQLTVVIAV